MFGKKKKLEAQQAAEQEKQEDLLKQEPEVQNDEPVEEANDQDFLDSELVLDDIEVEAEVLSEEEAAQLDELQAFLMGEAPNDEEAPVEEAPAEEAPAEEPAPEAQAEEQPEEEKAEEPAAEEPAPEEPAAEEPVEEEPAAEEPAEEPVEEEAAPDEEPAEEEEEVAEEPAEEPAEKPAEEGDQEEQEEVVYVVDGPEEDDEVVHPAKLVKLPHLIDYMIAQGMSKTMKMRVALMLVQTYKKFKDSPEDNKICLQCMAKIMQELMKK